LLFLLLTSATAPARLLLPFPVKHVPKNTLTKTNASQNDIKGLKFIILMMPLSYYLSGSFLYNSTTNVFNVIALISAILLIVDPILFIAHTGYNFYLSRQTITPAPEKPTKGRSKSSTSHLQATPTWWKWYAVAATIHLLDAWFFRSIIPFFERARASKGLSPPDDMQDLADICRLLWGIIRALSIFVIGLEIWENRLDVTKSLGQNYKNPKWGFALSFFLAPGIIALSALPVVGYLVFLGCWNSLGFLSSVIKEALKPDWRRGQDVFVKTSTKVVTVVPTETPRWKIWGVVPGA